jgi:putative addiction module component (TIGR02574 family)
MDFQELKMMALRLPFDERAELADDLMESLEHPTMLEITEIEQRWANMITRRIDELRSGKVKGIPGDVALEKLRKIVESQVPI